MNSKNKKEIRESFGKYLRDHRVEVLKIKSVRELSFSSNLDNSKLSKIEKGQINFGFDTLLEVAIAYKLSNYDLLGFAMKFIDEEAK